MSQMQIDDVIAHFKEILAKGEKVMVMDGAAAVAELNPVADEGNAADGTLVPKLGRFNLYSECYAILKEPTQAAIDALEVSMRPDESAEEYIARVNKEAEARGDFKKPRVFGTFEGQGEILPSFFDPLPDDELALWNGDVDEGPKL